MGIGLQFVPERTGLSGTADAGPAALVPGPVSGGALLAAGSSAMTTPERTAAGTEPGVGVPGVDRGGSGRVAEALEDSAEALEVLRESAPAAAALFDAWEAADFAGRVEELSRTIDYLQILAAHAVERTREEAKHTTTSAPGWRTGWTEPTTPAAATGAGSVLDDGYRNAAEFLRARCRIDIREARRRLTQAAILLPGTTLTGQPTPPRYEHLAHALASTHLPSRTATIITTALDTIAPIAHPELLATMEQTLTHTGTQTDPDFLAKTARHWINRIDQDGPEPTEEELRTRQGAFLRKPRRGLHHLEIFATDEQYETLTTLMNTATNPRLPHPTTNTGGTGSTGNNTDSNTGGTGTAGNTPHTGSTGSTGSTALPDLDRRSRAQKLLDGLVNGCQLALATGKLPANGGLKPQVTVTIDYRDLYTQLTNTNPQNPNPSTGTGTGPSSGAPRLSSSTATFTGPIHPNTIRKIACDANILPVLLGTDGQILDIGRTSRTFPPHLRKALNARDQGCTFPNCTIPAPWCEAHHITYWSQTGPTSTNNAALLCTHHHHLIHKEQWKITTKNGTPLVHPTTPRRPHPNTPTQPPHPTPADMSTAKFMTTGYVLDQTRAMLDQTRAVLAQTQALGGGAGRRASTPDNSSRTRIVQDQGNQHGTPGTPDQGSQHHTPGKPESAHFTGQSNAAHGRTCTGRDQPRTRELQGISPGSTHTNADLPVTARATIIELIS
ncbi:DUF222 domain-containing protein [Paenarthrobacter sp. S56]|uniref:HNH endonuclease signature motif containing protein n=1 Tax=Paenarthrobacter sp. S56 TaxID=3138179 RepID=UPI0032193A4C